jgi:hypothetical protein
MLRQKRQATLPKSPCAEASLKVGDHIGTSPVRRPGAPSSAR